MKKVILLLALGFFTFSATSLMAQTPKVTNVETQEVKKEPTRDCSIKNHKPEKGRKCTRQACTKTGKCAKGCVAKNQKKALHPKAKDLKAAHARKACCSETKGKQACNHNKGKQTLKQTSRRVEKEYKPQN